MIHKMGYEHTCTGCGKSCRAEDIGDPENDLCIKCHDAEMEAQEKYWRSLYDGEKRAGLLSRKDTALTE